MTALKKGEKPGKDLPTKFLEFLKQNGQSRWSQLERLVGLPKKNSRSARTWDVLKVLKERSWIEKKMVQDSKGKSRPVYFITDIGKRALESRMNGSQLTASAPFYFKNGEVEFVSLGEELDSKTKKDIIKIFEKHPRLRRISCVDRERSKKL
ncbi:MAG: helix-turn-helix transcriptional regulator [Candidatus Bathyarchaeota archaeon]|jgi:DNA-binding PadR family transcriptional regulator